jgi:4-diphosphocytidyl-2-C-methyl-D-erythritol kinase
LPVETVLAYAKLTTSLRVVGVRPSDGYHLIDAEMVTLDYCDLLRIDPSGSNSLPGDNLVSRALVAVGRDASVSLVKRIPAGAGLGGGSADAAAVLRWAGMRLESGVDVALALGADVPFCLLGGGRARVQGVGEVVEVLPDLDLVFTLLTPPLHVSTPAVYAAWDRLGGPVGVAGGNDLEPAALAVEPRLAEWRDRLGEATGVPPRLAGSGGTWFVEGEFPNVPGAVVARTLPRP